MYSVAIVEKIQWDYAVVLLKKIYDQEISVSRAKEIALLILNQLSADRPADTIEQLFIQLCSNIPELSTVNIKYLQYFEEEKTQSKIESIKTKINTILYDR